MDDRTERRLHDSMRFLGLRATPTAAGLFKLVGELERAGVLDATAVVRIKTAMIKDLCLAAPPHMRTGDFEDQIGLHLTRLLSGDEAPGTRACDAPRPD
jgi:hypothetical protein